MKNEIIELRKNGKSYNDIAEILNCSKGTISYHCKNIENNNKFTNLNKQKKDINQIKNINIINFGNDISDDIIKDVILYRKNHDNYNQIIEKTKLSLDKIVKICREYNLNDYQIPNEYEIGEMTKYYNEVKSLKKVASKFGWCYKTIRKYIMPTGKYLTTEEYNIKRKKDLSRYVVKWRQDKKIKLVEYKGGECEKCGYKKSISALSFHHKDPNEKDFSISSKSYSFERLKQEVDKCMLVCQNCHIEIHDEIKNKIAQLP